MRASAYVDPRIVATFRAQLAISFIEDSQSTTEVQTLPRRETNSDSATTNAAAKVVYPRARARALWIFSQNAGTKNLESASKLVSFVREISVCAANQRLDRCPESGAHFSSMILRYPAG